MGRETDPPGGISIPASAVEVGVGEAEGEERVKEANSHARVRICMMRAFL